MMTPALADIRRRALAALIPPPRLPLSQWIEANLRIPEGVSATPGAIRLWPWQRGIADAIGDPQIDRVTIVKPGRCVFTTLLTGTVAADLHVSQQRARAIERRALYALRDRLEPATTLRPTR